MNGQGLLAESTTTKCSLCDEQFVRLKSRSTPCPAVTRFGKKSTVSLAQPRLRWEFALGRAQAPAGRAKKANAATSPLAATRAARPARKPDRVGDGLWRALN